MNGKDIINALGDIDCELILDASPENMRASHKERIRISLLKYIGAVACCAFAILLLGVIIFNRGDIEYEVYERDDLLDDIILSEEVLAASSSAPVVYSFTDIKRLLEKEAFEPYVVTIGEYDPYYVCAYADRETIEILEDVDVSIYLGSFQKLMLWLGRSQYMLKYRVAVQKKLIEVEKHPLVWYKIPKTDGNIPDEIEDKSLVIVAETKPVTYTNLRTQKTTDGMCYFENKSVYADSFPWDAGDFDKVNDEYLEAFNEFLYVTDDPSLDILSYQLIIMMHNAGFEITEIDSEKYVNAEEMPYWGKDDLREMFEYILLDRKTYPSGRRDSYMFKFFDIKYLLDS